jgi:hypothetical protein
MAGGIVSQMWQCTRRMYRLKMEWKALLFRSLLLRTLHLPA